MITLLFALLIASNISNGMLTEKFDETLLSVREAYMVGADVSELVNRLNTALILAEEIDKKRFNSCSSYNECMKEIDAILLSTLNDARALKKSAEDSMNGQRLVMFTVYVPLVSFISSLISLFIYNRWKRYQMKKFLSLYIRIKTESK